jgi:nucleotide-binding universal stress UspA family protein
MFSTIIHPTDLSDAAAPALKAAHELAKSLGAKLIICYIAHPPLVASGNQLTDPETNETRNILDEFKAVQPPNPAVNCEVKIVTVDRSAGAKAMLKILEQMGSDLIVLGMHKRTGISGWLGASITEDVVRLASCAVMVVKQCEEDS